MNNAALFNLTYGLYLCTAKEGLKDNGCIINTAVQVANDPLTITIAVNKNNLTCEMISRTETFNISALTTDTPFDFFQKFGMTSGRNTNKFEDASYMKRSANGVYYLTKNTNMYLSAKVLAERDLGTHMLFIAEVFEAEVLSDGESCSYAYYHKNIKPQPKANVTKEKKWTCNVCGYEYDGKDLPDDFICPLCKHPKEDFSLI